MIKFSEIKNQSEPGIVATDKGENSLINIVRNEIKLRGNDADLNYIDTSNVTDMSNIFDGLEDFCGDISQWNTSNVVTFRYGHLDINKLKERIEQNALNVPYVVEVTHCDEMDRVGEFKKAFKDVNITDTPLV